MASAAGDRSVALVAGLVLAALLRPLGCGAPDPTTQGSPEVRAVLADVGPEVVAPALDSALSAATLLAEACAAWESAVSGTGDAEAARLEAQIAWRDALGAWQAVEVLQIGPAASSLDAVGGQDLRDEVYSWPSVNRCRVDQVTVQGGWDAPDFFDVNLVNVYGLAALEVLLFAGGDNGCPPQVDINADGTWDALGEDGLAAARASYAAALSVRVANDVGRLAQAWDPAAGDFGEALASAGTDGSPYESETAALNAILDALFYLEGTLKERKLARPLGISDCTGTACLEEVESPLAGESNRWVQINLASARVLYAGGDGYGLEDLLRDLGRGDVSDALSTALMDAENAALDLVVPVEVAAVSDRDAAVEVYDAVDVVVDLLEGDVATLLVLEVPDEAAGDND